MTVGKGKIMRSSNLWGMRHKISVTQAECGKVTRSWDEKFFSFE